MDTPPLQAPAVAAPNVINMGSGKDWKADCLNLDVSQAWNPDLVFDLNQPLPPGGLLVETPRFGLVRLADGCFDAILCNDVLEHIPQLMTAMTTCLRLLKVGGAMHIHVPYDLSYGAWQDPTHVRAFNERSWLYYTDWFWYLNWDSHRFDIRNLQFILSPVGVAMHQRQVDQESILRTPRAVDSMKVELVKRDLTPQERAQYAMQHAQQKSAAPLA